MKDRDGLNILDALENLNTLVDAESLEEIEVTENALLIPHKDEIGGGDAEAYWVKAGLDDQTLDAVKETFRTVHAYLQTFYGKMKKGGDTKRLVEGINTIMVLVGEAAKNLERFGTLFKKRVGEFEEYKQLQNFYRNRVIKESFREFARAPLAKVKFAEVENTEETLEEELQELLGETEIEEISGVHILNDVEVIKRDHLYELFYLKNEAAHNFYTYALARNIKLACDFGEFAEEYFGDDPLIQIKNWEDKSLHLKAKTFLQKCSPLIHKFYEEAMKYKEMDVVTCVHNSLMALMLAANSRNLIRQFSLKGCHLYFHDFLFFLRATLHNREFEKFLIYSPPAGKPFFQDLIDLVHALCYQLYTMPQESVELTESLKLIIERERHKKEGTLSQMLFQANYALNEAFKKHPNGPVFKAVDIVRDPNEHFLDLLHQGNIPAKEWSLISQEGEISVLRMPSPVIQEMVNKAYIIEEFKSFLHSLHKGERLLCINFQDRTSWREHARSFALEELARHAEFANTLTVVTLAKDTDFYNQVGVYQELHEASVFIEHFLQHLGDEVTGYYFPPTLKSGLFPQFMKELLHQIHETFFDRKAEFSFLERLNFIELSYHFIEWKLLELVKPAWVSFMSKDGLDITGTTHLGIIALLTLPKRRIWNEKECDQLQTLLFGPTLMNRERVIHPERFERLISMIHLLEGRGDYLQDFKHLFSKGSLEWGVKLH